MTLWDGASQLGGLDALLLFLSFALLVLIVDRLFMRLAFEE